MAKTRRSTALGSGTKRKSKRYSLREIPVGKFDGGDAGSDVASEIASDDSFVVADNVIIPDSSPESEDESGDEIFERNSGLRSSQKEKRSSSRSSSRSKMKKRKRIKLESTSSGEVQQMNGTANEEDEEEDQKCYNPNCPNRVDTPKELKRFCTSCIWWEHPFHLAIHDCQKDGNFNCFFCEQLKQCRGRKSMTYQNLETMPPIELFRGEDPSDYPDPDQSQWKFHWNKFIKTNKSMHNVKLGDCLRIKQKNGKMNYLIRVNYLFVDGKNKTWVMGYQILDMNSKEIHKFSKEDFEVDNRNMKKVFPTQKFLMRDILYYSLDQFEITEVICVVWYKEYYESVRGFPEDRIYPFVFNYYTNDDMYEIEFVAIPDWRVCKYEFIEKTEKDTKSIGVSTDEPQVTNQDTTVDQIPNETNPRIEIPSTSSAPVRVKQEPMEVDPTNLASKIQEMCDQEMAVSRGQGTSMPAREEEEELVEGQESLSDDALLNPSIPSAEEIEWPNEEEEENRAREQLARQLLKTCLLPRTPLVIHPDIDLQEPTHELKVSWRFPL